MTARTCANCACGWAREIDLPGGGKASTMMCRRNPPVAMPQKVTSRVAATSSGQGAESMQLVLTYPPTAAELVCWQWVPEGTLPGDNAAIAAILPAVKVLASKAGIKIPIEYPVGLSE